MSQYSILKTQDSKLFRSIIYRTTRWAIQPIHKKYIKLPKSVVDYITRFWESNPLSRTIITLDSGSA